MNRRAKRHRNYIVDTIMLLQTDILNHVDQKEVDRALIKSELIAKYKKRLNLIKLITG